MKTRIPTLQEYFQNQDDISWVKNVLGVEPPTNMADMDARARYIVACGEAFRKLNPKCR
jgi:hypothetical protein